MFTVYKITNIKTDEYYIGVHKTKNPNDRYLGSGIHIKNQVRKYGRNNFVKTILFNFDNEEQAFNKEIELVEQNRYCEKCLNIGPGGIGGAKFKGKHHSQNSKLKLREQKLGRVCIHNEFETKRPKKEELEKYLSEGWQLGKHEKDCQFGRKAWNKGKKLGPKNKEIIKKIKETARKNVINKKRGDYKHSEEIKAKIRLKALEREQRKRDHRGVEKSGISLGS